MKRASLIAAVSIIVIANALALAHAARNRAGNAEAEVTLTNRELRYYNRSASDDSSGVTLRLGTANENFVPWPIEFNNPSHWLDQQALQRLGFDCSVNAADPDAARFYQRQQARRAFVALEYDGPAWRTWAERYKKAKADAREAIGFADATDLSERSSRLAGIDADLDAAKLRARHPDRTNVVVVPGVVHIALIPVVAPGVKMDPKRPVRLSGRIDVPSSIHVPRPFSDTFRDLGRKQREDLSYRVHLRYGSLLEPWVTGVEFTNSH